jgi:hypothetical protein
MFTSFSVRRSQGFFILFLVLEAISLVHSFIGHSQQGISTRSSWSHHDDHRIPLRTTQTDSLLEVQTRRMAAKGFGVVERETKAAPTTDTEESSSPNINNDTGEDDLTNVNALEVKRRLLDLLPRMMGTPDEFKQVESYINVLEDRYQPVQTLDFLNLAMEGDWQLLFSTNLSAGPKSNFRIKELYQSVQTNKLEGTLENCAAWDLAQDENNSSTFDASGTMTVKCSYKINQGARMVVDLEDHVLELAKGSAVPKDVEGLVGLLHRTMPKELFDPNEHAMDTTYLDVDLRLVRLTGPRFEGIRNVFVRRGSMEINPV